MPNNSKKKREKAEPTKLLSQVIEEQRNLRTKLLAIEVDLKLSLKIEKESCRSDTSTEALVSQYRYAIESLQINSSDWVNGLNSLSDYKGSLEVDRKSAEVSKIYEQNAAYYLILLFKQFHFQKVETNKVVKAGGHAKLYRNAKEDL